MADQQPAQQPQANAQPVQIDVQQLVNTIVQAMQGVNQQQGVNPMNANANQQAQPAATVYMSPSQALTGLIDYKTTQGQHLYKESTKSI